MKASPSSNSYSIAQFSAVALSIYLTASVTAFPPGVVMFPLLVSGLLLAWGSDAEAFTVIKREAFAPVVLFLISYVISTVLSYSARESLDACMVLFPSLLIAYICCHLATQHYRIICWGIVGMVMSASLTTLWMFLESPENDPGRVFMTGKTPALVVANDMLLGVIFTPIIVYLLITEKRLFLKIVTLLVLLTLLIALYFVKSRICFLTAVFMGAIYLRHAVRGRLTSWFLALVGIILFIDAILGLNILSEFMLVSQQNARLSIWYCGVKSAFEHPFVGFGPSMFYMAYEQALATSSFPEWMMVDGRIVPWAHNIYLDALVERGVLGLIALLYIATKIYKPLAYYLKDGAGKIDQFQLAIYASYAGFLFAGFFELSMQRIWVANALFLFVGFAFINEKNRHLSLVS